MSSRSISVAMDDLPEPDRPVSHRVRPCPRSARCTEPACQTTFEPRSAGPMIMPAATVSPVCSSTSTKAPVSRLRRYGSYMSGACVRSVMRPISLSSSTLASGSRWSVLTSSRYSSEPTTARVSRVVCRTT